MKVPLETKLTPETKITTGKGSEITLNEVIEAMKQKLPNEFTINHSSPLLSSEFGLYNEGKRDQSGHWISNGYIVINGERCYWSYNMLVRYMANSELINRVSDIQEPIQRYSFK